MTRRRLHGGIVTAILLLALPLTAAPARSATSGGFLLGVYDGNQGWAMDQVRALEAWQGKRNAVVNLFTNWDSSPRTRTNLFSQQLPNIWANGNIPLITWEPFTGKNTPVDIERRIASGQYDVYVADWAARLRRFLDGQDAASGTADDRRAYLRLGHEMNGNWYPWGAAVGGNSPGDFVNMWRRVHAAFDALGLGPSRLQWIWAVNHEDVGDFPAEAFFPGEAYVDWVAVDGYNWGATQSWSSWRSPSEVLDPMVRRMRTLSGRPLALTETATTSVVASGSSLPAKSQWVTELFDYAVVVGARMVIWFNEDKETDWAVFGGAKGDTTFRYGRTTFRAFSAYRAAVSRPQALSPVPGDARLLTDAQFAGAGP
jgi:mannan endo-1,4-beta-mannosidase